MPEGRLKTKEGFVMCFMCGSEEFKYTEEQDRYYLICKKCRADLHVDKTEAKPE